MRMRARRMSTSIDTTIATMTPFRMPISSAAAKATIDTLNSSRLTRHTWRSSATLTSPFTATSTIAASITFGRLLSRPARYMRHRPMVTDANTSASGVPAPALSFTEDCECRPPPDTLEESGREIRRAQAEAVPGADRPRSRAPAPARAPPIRFHVRQQQARKREWNHPVHVAHPQPRQAELRQALRQRADHLEAERAERRHRQHDDRDHDHQQRDRASRQEFLAEQQDGDCGDTECEHREVRGGKLASQHRDALEEVVTAARDAEQLGQLVQRDRQRGARLEAEQDRLADEIDERTQPKKPCAADSMAAMRIARRRCDRYPAPGSSAMPATVTPTSIEIAEVGPIARCRDEPNNA